jgi:beta-lactamase regulating signal transducer with metallopeptidase domain/peroxiredoxin
MNGLFTTSPAWIGQSAGTGLEIAIRVALLVSVVALVSRALGSRRVLARAALWHACILGSLLVPLTMFCLPSLSLALLPSRPLADDAVAQNSHAALAENSITGTPAFIPSGAVPRSDGTASGNDVAGAAAAPRSGGVADGPPPRAVAPRVVPAHRRWPEISGVSVGLFVYVLGIVVMLARLAGSVVAVRRMQRSGESVGSGAWMRALARWRVELGIRSTVELRRTQQVSVPAVVGWSRPIILLPETITDAAEPAVVDGILLHELCHIRRADYAWNMVVRIAQTVFWPHPFVWMACRAAERAREQVCDELCVRRLAGASAYRAVLLDVASALIRRPGPSLGLAMARTSRLERRLARIDNTSGIAECVLSSVARVTLTLALGLVIVLAGAVRLSRGATVPTKLRVAQPVPVSNAAAQKPEAARDAKTFDFLAQDDTTGKPIPDVTVRIRTGEGTRFVSTNADGLAKIPRPSANYGSDIRFGRAFFYSIEFWKDGYIQDRKYWSDYDPRFTPIPDSFTARLKHGVARVSGTVKGESGTAIEGATVELIQRGRKPGTGVLWELPVTTDAEGHWSTGSIPPDCPAIDIYATHPSFVRGTRAAAPIEMLVAGTSVIVLKRGAVIEGRVFDDAARPIHRASIVVATTGDLQSDESQTQSDADGRFLIANVQSGIKSVTISAPGRAPETRRVQANGALAPLEFRLGVGSVLKGRVVDSAGKPVADAAVFATISTPPGQRGRQTGPKWNGRTGAEGRFVWTGAPQASLSVSAIRPGSLPVVQEVRAGDAETTWVLGRSVRVQGTVTDAKSSQPIRRFDLTSTPNLLPANPSRSPGALVMRSATQFDLRVDAPLGGFTITIVADGYKPFTSRRFAADETIVTYDINLQRLEPGEGGGPTGVVLGLDGKPLAEAEVQMATTSRSLLVTARSPYVGGENFIQGAAYTTSDEKGSFTFQPVKEPFELAISHRTGFARISSEDLAKTRTVQIQRWGRIEGQVAKSVMREGDDVRVRSAPPIESGSVEPRVHAQYNGRKIDPNGQFVIDYVMPDTYFVDVNSSRTLFRVGSMHRIVVRSGETTHVSLGAIGRVVSGRIAPAAGEPPLSKGLVPPRTFANAITPTSPRIPFPIALLKLGDRDQEEAWAKRWSQTPEGKARLDHASGNNVEYKLVGTFRADSVEPGEYYVHLALHDPQQPELGNVIMARKRVVVPDGPADSTFDAGTIPTRRLGHPQAGDVAPPIVAETLDGKPFRLGDLRGKFVVLYFWTANVGNFWRPTREGRYNQIADLEAVRKKFGHDPRLAILGLSLDIDRDAARKFVAEAGHAWTQVALGDWPDTPIPASYGVESLTTTFILGPDGKIRSRFTHDGNIEQELTKMLGAQ